MNFKLKDMKSVDIERVVRLIRLGDLHVDEELTFFEPQPEENTNAIKLSIEQRGNRSQYVAVHRNNKLVLIDGIRRHPIELELYGPDHEALVWVIQEDLTDEAIHWYRIDRAKTKKKLKTDIVSEFKFRDKHTPNSQGKKTDLDYRRKRIAREIGVSPSTLNDLLWIDSIQPLLLRAVDRGEMTLKKARADAKKLQEARQEKEQMDEMDEVSPNSATGIPVFEASNKTIDLNAVITCCPCCNVPFSKIEWQDIPSIFHYKRKEDEQQRNWLKEVA